MSSVAAVIPNWNTARHLSACLDSLAAQRVDIEILVVDNGSSDESIQLLTARRVPHVALTENVGFARAVNLGVAKTAAPLILVLNADCVLAEGCLATMNGALAEDARIGGVQPRILQARETHGGARIYSAGQSLTRCGVAFERGWDQPDGPQFGRDCEVFGVSGAACLLRRELFDELGGYDESYFAFYEDVDLNARARLRGWSFRYVADAVSFHVGHAGWGNQQKSHSFNVELTVRNRLATAIKVLPPRGVLCSFLVTLRSLAGSVRRGTSAAAMRGAFTALSWMPRLLRERRRLRARSADLLDSWLARNPDRGPDPKRS